MTERSIFIAALDIDDDAEQAAYLAEACGTDTGLRQRVEKLLQSHDRAGSFMEQPAVGEAPEPAVVPPSAAIGNLPSPIAEGPGTVIGRYKLLEQIGEGGMGVVFMAEQRQPVRRLVALKIVKPGMDSRQVVARFEAERQALALMEHPNIAHVLDGGETASGRPFFVMELVKGVPITTYCDDHELTPRQRLELFIPICQAIQHAHQKGIIHRDLKPSNVMVALYDSQPVPKVIDFGVAKALRERLTERTMFTGYGQIVGTLEYMSPEQAQLNALDIDTRSDIHALGVLLYELLTGTTPFEKKRLRETPFDEVLRIIREEEPPKPSTRLHSSETLPNIAARRKTEPNRLPRLVRGELDWIVMKALEKDRSRRYQTAEALAEDLRRFLADRPIQARRPHPVERIWRWCRRNPAVAALLGVVVTLSVLIAIGAAFAALRLGHERDTAVDNLGRAERAEQDATEKLFKSAFAHAQALRRSGQMGQRFGTLETLEEAVRIAKSLGVLDDHRVALRSEAVASMALTDLRVAAEWDGPTNSEVTFERAVAFDPALERYAYDDEQGNLRIMRTADRQEMARLPGPGASVRGVSLRFGPGGRFLTATYWLDGRPDQFDVWELPDAQPPRKVDWSEVAVPYAFSADGRWLAAAQPDGSILLYDLVKERRQNLAPGRHAWMMAFRPDGQQLAFVSHLNKWDVEILDLETDRVIKRLNHPDDVGALAWSADGRLLAAGCDDRNVHVWDTAEWRRQSVLQGHQKWVVALAFSPVGDLLASAAQDGTTRLWDPISGQDLVSAPGTCLHFSPDGRRLAFRRGRRLGFWEVADGRECRVLHHGRVGNQAPWLFYKGPECLDFSPDGRLLVSAAGDGVRLWEVSGCREVAYLNAGHHEAALFHADGARLYTFGRTGLRCWPVQPVESEAHSAEREPGSAVGPALRALALRVGPPELLGTPAIQGWFRGSRSADGGLIAAGDHLDDERDRLFVFPVSRPADRNVLDDRSKFARIALSPDGRWVAAGVIKPASGIQVWDARTGQLEWSFSCEPSNVRFSPDGQWLLGGGKSDYRLWKTGSWEAGPAIPRDRREMWFGGAAFTPDGGVLAVARSLQHIQLLDFATRQEIATVAGPDLPCLDWMCFSPDGGLLAVATESHTIQLWDLGAINRRLRAMGLGCDLLPSSPAGPPGAVRFQVRVFQEVYEAEHLKVIDSAQCPHSVQDMKPWGREHWSNGKQLLCQAEKSGNVELEVDVPETGRYEVEVRLTRAPGHGLVEVSLDGARVGAAFDGYDKDVTPSVPVRLGTMELREGSHRLRFTAVDKNPKAAAYWMGIDCVKLTSTSAKRH